MASVAVLAGRTTTDLVRNTLRRRADAGRRFLLGFEVARRRRAPSPRLGVALLFGYAVDVGVRRRSGWR